ncbi:MULTISPECIES: hypothetical protein [unclassified Bacillus (in: firmicutes)]|uniref:hypothetical protein n=1 Tax=unclassified Bacillus (in: firmicutes) TaxID=185979 RepID=UPI0030F68089
MSKINEIQMRLGELNGGEFQNLMDAYFAKEIKGELYPIGSVLANNNTKTGTPDTLIKSENRMYVYIEYTVQKSNVVSKFKEDIQKCLDENKTGISNGRIEKIICCCNTRLSTGEIEEIILEGSNNGVSVDVVSLDAIAYKLIEYPLIMKDFLGISIDTQQILDIDDFIRFNDSAKFATPLDIDIFGRDKEIEDIIRTINEKQITVLSGTPGVGKTRLSVESVRRFITNHTEYKVKCLRNNGQNLYEDLNLYFNEPGYYLLMIDDANLLTNMQLILDLFSWKFKGVHIKLLFTVREYAEDKIKEKISKYEFKIFKINTLKEDDINLLCDHFEIKNPRYVERICEISKGNPRLAIMACNTARRENTLKSIANVIDLVEVYFKDVKFHFEMDLENDDLLKVAAIISFLNNVHLKDNENIEIICNIANVQKEYFIDLISKLHSMEIIDIYEDELVKVSDQILSVYLFYLTIFRRKLISYDVFISNYYPNLKNRIIDNLNNVFSYFYKEEHLKFICDAIKEKYNKIIKSNNKQVIEEYLNTFWFALEIEGLIYAKEQINQYSIEESKLYKFELDKNNKEYSSVLSLLSHYAQSKYYREAIDLILDYLDKKPSEFSDVYYVLTDSFGFNDKSINYGYTQELEMLQKITKKCNSKRDALSINLLVKMLDYFLKFGYEYTKMKSNRKVIFYKIPLTLDYKLSKIREITWDILIDLYSNGYNVREINTYLYNYARRNVESINKEILNFDKNFIEILISDIKELTLEQSIVFNRLRNLLSKHGISLNNNLEKKLNSYEYQVYKRLFADVEYKEQNRVVEEQDLITWSKDFTDVVFQKIFKICNEIIDIKFVNSKVYAASDRIEFIILNAPQEKKMDILKLFFKENLRMNIHPQKLVRNIDKLEQLEDIILGLEFFNKSFWLYCIYEEMSINNASSELLAKIYNYFEKSEGDVVGYLRDLSFLKLYIDIDDNVFINVINTLLNQEDILICGSIESFLKVVTDDEKYIKEYIKNDFELLKRLYLKVLKIERHFDYDSAILKTITRHEKSILSRIINSIIEDEENTYEFPDNIDLQFIWEEENWLELAEDISKLIMGNVEVRDKYYVVTDLLEKMFHLDKEASEIHKERVFQWIDIKIIEWAANDLLIKLLFECLTVFDDNKRIDWLYKLLQVRTEFNFFKIIPLFSGSYSWSGSEVPLLIGRKQFFECLESKLEGLQFLEHKRWLQERIEYVNQEIKVTKIKELVEDI